MAQSITLMNATYNDVPAVDLPKTGGGTARFTDTSDADATASDILDGKTAYVNGDKVTGTLVPSGTSVDLLWTNPTPTSSSGFSAQTISISNLSNYLFLLVTVKSTYNTNYYSTTMVQVDENISTQQIYSFYGPYQRSVTEIDTTNSTIRITGSGGNCIPYQIRGVK